MEKEFKSLMENCSRENSCDAPHCPLWKENFLVIRLPEDDICPYCRTQKKKGVRKKMPKGLRKLVLKENVYLLSKKNR